MRHVLTCLVVALACTLFLTYPALADELENESVVSSVEVLDFSGSVKDGREVVVKSTPIFPDPGTSGSWEDIFKTFYKSFDNVTPDGSGSQTWSWIGLTRNTIIIAIPVIVGAVFFWWGLRKTISAIMSAFKRGKLKL